MDPLMEQVKGLNPKTWVSQYGDLLYAYTFKRIPQREQAEDIVQEVFLSAWKARESFDHSVEEKTWLFVICQRKIIDHFRKRSAVVAISLETDDQDTGMFLEDGHFDPAYRPGQPWGVTKEGMMQKEFYAVLRQCASRLKQLQEQVFSLKYLNDLDTEEICSLLNITDKNYWVLMHRAKVQLRACMEKNWLN